METKESPGKSHGEYMSKAAQKEKYRIFGMAQYSAFRILITVLSARSWSCLVQNGQPKV